MATVNPCEINGSQAVADAVAAQYAGRVQAVSQSLLDGTLTLDQWHTTMQDIIRLAYVHQAIAGTPGADERELTSADLARVRADIAEQYQFLDDFAAAIEDALQRGADINFVPARAMLYAGSSEAEYWKQAVNIDLPALPRDGSTQCLSNCQCSWDLNCQEPGIVSATWVLGEADHCPDCQRRASEWNPLVIEVRH